LNDTLLLEIEALRSQKTKALQARYHQLFGEESPSCNRNHLFRRIAWRLQALEMGDLTERARQRALLLSHDVDLRLRAPRDFWKAVDHRENQPPDTPERDPRLPRVGTILRRTYRGQLVEVEVLEDGFQYNGQHYASLSSIASAATGTRWNGFAFFGLKGMAANV